jgi:NitT/TauT family transport system substrate-binding protein
MSGQVDIGWSAPPFGVEALEEGKIRIVARASDVPELRSQTVRVMVSNVPTVEGRKGEIDRFMAAYRETLAWMYSSPDAIKAYAEWVKVPEKVAQRARDDFFPKDNLRLDRLEGVDLAMADAVTYKFLAAPLTKEEQATFFSAYAKP